MIVFDTETTGLVQPQIVPLNKQPQCIEFCAVKLDDKTLKEVSFINFLINPGIKLPPEIVRITNIRDEDLVGQLPFAHRYSEIADFFLGERYIAGHNLDFDRQILSFELKRLAMELAFPWPPRGICTVEASFSLENKRIKLGDLYKKATDGGELKGAHRAINDVRGTAVCIRWLKSKGLITLK